jgi:hypothetical protein
MAAGAKLTWGALIAGISGLILAVDLFLPWYPGGATVDAFGNVVGSGSLSGFEAFGFVDIVLLVIGIAAIVLAGMTVMRPGVPIVGPLMIIGTIASSMVFAVLVELDNPKVGPFLAIVSGIGVIAGGLLIRHRPNLTFSLASGGGPGYGQQGQYAPPPQQGGFQQPYGGAPPTAAQGYQPPPPPPGGGAPPPPPGGTPDWYPDPHGQKRLRYFDGNQWTEHTAD